MRNACLAAVVLLLTLSIVFPVRTAKAQPTFANGQATATDKKTDFTDWKESDWRIVNGVTECVWTDKGWVTFILTVREGVSWNEIIADGFTCSYPPLPKAMSYILKNYDKHPRNGEKLLIQAKFWGVKRSPNYEALDGNHDFAVLDYGSSVSSPPDNVSAVDLVNLNVRKKLFFDNAQKTFDALKASTQPRVETPAERQAREQAASQKRVEVDQKRLQADFEYSEKGYPSFQYSLGMRYLNGDGVEQNDKLAKEWLEKSATQGSSEAKAALAKMSAPQTSSQTPVVEITDKLLKAQMEYAQKGLPSFQYDLGMRYINGDGVDRSEKVGRDWLEKSAAQGNSDAKKALQELNGTTKQ
jgi:hypothetical protein